MVRPAVPAALLLALSACAGAGGPAAIGARPLQYDAPTPNRSTYAFATSTAFSVDAGPIGIMRLGSEQAGVAAVVFRREDGEDGEATGVESTIRFVEYAARFENPNQGAVEVDESDITGSWKVRLDERGRLEVLDAPALSGPATEIAVQQNMVRPLFVLLPGRAVESGDQWVDTVSTDERAAGTATRSRSVIRSTLTGDTVVDGRWLVVIRTEAATTVEIEGSSGGVEVIQRLSGTTLATILWDPVAALLVARTEDGELEGTLELPGTGFGALPVSGTVRRTVSLQP